jgi:C4-dicarboxylate-specific signal transduction histidine kinase
MKFDSKLRRSDRCHRDIARDLARANRADALTYLTESISQEIRQPLAATVICASAASRWLAANPPNLTEAAKALERIVCNAFAADEVVNRVRASVVRHRRWCEQISLAKTIHEAVAALGGELEDSRIAVTMAVERPLPPVTGDRSQLLQVILNLMIHAIETMRASDGPRELTVAARRCGERRVRIEIANTGPGIDAEVLQGIFDPMRARSVLDAGFELSLCCSIVEAHGGTLTAERRPTGGMTFAVELGT